SIWKKRLTGQVDVSEDRTWSCVRTGYGGRCARATRERRKGGGVMLKGFKEFIAMGNVIDLAVGVIIGAAFGAVVDSLVKDVITPGLGMLGGVPDFSTLKAGSVSVGNFINAIIAFLLKAAGLYVFIVLP